MPEPISLGQPYAKECGLLMAVNDVVLTAPHHLSGLPVKGKIQRNLGQRGAYPDIGNHPRAPTTYDLQIRHRDVVAKWIGQKVYAVTGGQYAAYPVQDTERRPTGAKKRLGR